MKGLMKNVCAQSFVLVLCSIFIANSQELLKNSEYGSVITNYLHEQQTTYKYSIKDLEGLVISDQVYSKNTGLTHIYLQQTVNGTKIQNAISSIAIKDNKVHYYANRLITDISVKINSSGASISAETAVSKVASHFDLGPVNDLVLESEIGNMKQFSRAGISGREIPTELIYFQDGNKLILSWAVTVYTLDSKHWWKVNIDAQSGAVLNAFDYLINCSFDSDDRRHNLSTPLTEPLFKSDRSFSVLSDGSSYNVFALPIESPSHGSRSTVSNPASSLASPFGWHDTDGFRGPEFTITRGNNVWAQEDVSGNNATGFSPDGGVALNFNFPLDFNQQPLGYQDAAVTNLFYTNNMMHDIFYHHGFDEESGNFQANNYGNGGEEGDFVFADAQDGSGFNNATFGTPPDGSNPVMTMFLWAGPPGNRLIVSNGPEAGTYVGVEALFGKALTPEPLEGELVVIRDSAESGDSIDGCDEILNGEELTGKIVLIKRGSCEFGTKVLKAENEGALAVIIVNNVPGAPFGMAPGADGGSVTIPSIMVSQADGEDLIASAIINRFPINAQLLNDGNDPFDLDGDFDNGIIAHEYGHGISNRLVGGPSNVECLFNIEQMGEGWSDWFGLMVTMKASDLPENRRGIGTYVLRQETDGRGIRPAPYSTSFSVNSFTFGDTNNTSLSVPHGVGFVWATVLWDLTWAYIDKYGFSDDLYNGNGGNNRVIKLVLDGLRLLPCNPGFIDGRDAILAADMATTGGVDQCMIWDVFAKRGLGFNANQGITASRTDQTESFDSPPADLDSLANCSTLSNEQFNLVNGLGIYPNPTNSLITIKSSVNLDGVVIQIIDLKGRVVIKKNQNLSSKETLDLSALKAGVYFINMKSEAIDYTTKIIKL